MENALQRRPRAGVACLLLVALALAGGCTTLEANPVDPEEHALGLVCIEKNPKVTIEAFPGVIEREFLRHGIRTEVYGEKRPPWCEYTLTYTARRKWDLVHYMAYAELRLARDRESIAVATYRHAGGFGFNKYASTESKMRRVIDRLLAGFPVEDGPPGAGG